MSINPLTLGRISTASRGALVSSTITRQQARLAEVQQQLTTGRRLAAPSDDAGDAAVAQSIRKLLERREAYDTNLGAAASGLAEVDSSLAGVTDLLREAQDVASANVGSDVTSEARTAAASIVDSIYSQMLSSGNKSVAGTYLYGGDRSTDAPFVEALGGVKWVGSSDLLSNTFDEGTDKTFQVDGAAVFGALSARVRGDRVLTPSIGVDTRLDDLGGALGEGVRRGIVQLSDGATTALVDLRSADTVGDVIDRLNAAGVGGINASINAAGDGIDLAAGAGDSVTLKELGGGSTAADLGILRATAGAPGDGVGGTSTAPRLTALTPLASLDGGAGLDLSGLTITNGLTTKSIDLASAVTVEDALNLINDGGANVRARINAAGTGIDILNAVQGTTLTIAERAGGATAAQLGVRSFAPGTLLADLNDGRGVATVDGAELRLADSAGVAFEVDLDGAVTVQDALNRINAAATAGGAGVVASFASATNGIVLSDTAAGTGTLVAANANGSSAVGELGLDAPATGGAIAGRDVGAVSSSGVFANLIRLRDALRNDDQAKITRAAELLDADTSRVVRVRGELGAKVQEFEGRQTSLADQNVSTLALLSELEDTDFTDAIVRFQTLQTSLQASLQAASTLLNMNLMDYLG